MKVVGTATLGYPRMGPKRELKFALEKYWNGTWNQDQLMTVAREVEESAWKLQAKEGGTNISQVVVTVGDQYLYDMVLTWAEQLGLVSRRFQSLKPGLDRMFAMARGIDGAEALSMKKWITSNYHYMVPECDETTKIQPHWDEFLKNVRRGIQFLGQGVVAAPVVLGPVTLMHLTKKSAPWTNENLLGALLPAYKQVLQDMAVAGVKEIQVHEPALVFADPNLLKFYKMAYPAILPDGPAINIVTFMDDVGEENYKWLISEPKFGIISLDFTRGKTLDLIETMGFPVDKTLGAGLIDSRNVWKFQPDKIVPLIQRLRSKISHVRIQPSSTLQYVPWDFACETELQNHPAACVLSFAKQKLQEIGILAKFAAGDESILVQHSEAWKNFANVVPLLPQKLHSPSDLERPEPYSQRRPKQLVGVPLLPTTTIGSFPQTAQIRRLRTQWKNGALTQKEYEAAIDQQIAYAIGIQEALGLDILVHGEAERTDMVEFFAKQMEGLIFTQNGWVQSFGSRCVRPPIIWTNISRPNPMTVREFQVAQALTSKPVKGMLTGPMTILNWSFPRIDIPRKDQAFQLALAIRKEVQDLEAAGCRVIQVDEPALREAMPLRSEEKDEYLDWAVDSFRLATAGAKSETQIHTHMCYCEFRDCMHAIDRMDTDVNSIENARNGNETLEAFVAIQYQKGFGPGVYDIHSPVVLPIAKMQDKIQSFLQCLEPEKLVINPDCGLKTRTWPETIGALQNMVAAAKEVRQAIGITS